MNKKSLSACINQIIADVELRKKVDYGNKCSVRQYNSAYDRIKKNVKYIERNYPDQIHAFVGLLSHPDQSVSYMCACMILDVLNCSSKVKQTALDEVKRQLAAGEVHPLNEFYLPVVIQRWEEKIAALEEKEMQDGSVS